ncbi:MAG: hypothetical protein NC251_12620 [Lachnoclostridium sp.]|nr:hypothetical protein [Lachnospira sp.]MCM1249257.1 hypothetical protein [Lachnoclostridium sp.]MCM1536398.1 hypothetical protein [Clostridium sp.]
MEINMKYAFKKTRRIIINDLATKKHKVTLNDLKNLKINGSQDVVYAEGANGAKLAAFDVNKVASITAENGSIDEGYLSLQVGSDVVKVTNGSSVLIREEFEVKDGDTSVTLSYKATGAAGNEVNYIYKADSNGLPGDAYTQNADVSASEFTYTPDTKTITLPTGAFKAGDTVIIDYYPMFSEYEEIANDANKFSMTGEVIVDAWFTDICTEVDVPLQLYLPKGKISGTIDLSVGDQAAVQGIEIESLTKACDGENKNLWVLRKYDMSNAQV